MFRWPITIYYEDTDAGGVVYHSNYLNFFERARTQWLKAIGVSQTQLLDEDIAFVVRKADIDFIHPAKFEQELVVETQLAYAKRASMSFSQTLVDQQGNTYCSGTILVACISLSRMKPRPIPVTIIQELSVGS